RVNVSEDATEVFARELRLFTQQIVDATRAIRLGPRVRQKVRIISPDDSLVCGDDDSRRRIVARRELRDRNVTRPLTRISRTIIRNTAVARFPDRDYTSRVITDVTVNIC